MPLGVSRCSNDCHVLAALHLDSRNGGGDASRNDPTVVEIQASFSEVRSASFEAHFGSCWAAVLLVQSCQL